MRMVHRLLGGILGAIIGFLLFSAAARDGFPPDAEGFIRNWMILEPIPLRNVQLTESGIQDVVKREYFQGQWTSLPKDGEAVSADGMNLIWHAFAAGNFNVNTYHFAYALGKPTSNVLFWGATIVLCPRELTRVRLAIGCNASSVWWVNGKEVIGNYGERQTVIDDAVSRRLTLNKGANMVRFALVNAGGATDFCARFLDPEDEPVKGFTVSLAGTGD